MATYRGSYPQAAGETGEEAVNVLSVIDAMKLAGISEEKILSVVQIMAKEADEKKALSREKARLRKQRSRENEKLFNINERVTQCHATSHIVTVTDCDGLPPLVPPSDGFPTPLPITPPLNPPHPAASNALDRTRLPHLDLPDDWKRWAVENRYWDDQRIMDVWTKFRRHWSEKIGRQAMMPSADWPAEWRNWCHREPAGKQRPTSSGNRPTPQGKSYAKTI